MSGSSSRRKGAEYEREVARRFRDVLGIEAIRSSPLQAGDPSAAPDVKTIPGLWIEAKRRKRSIVSDWLDKARTECPQSDVPALVMRKDGGESLIVVSLNDLPTLVALLSTSPAVLRLLHSGY